MARQTCFSADNSNPQRLEDTTGTRYAISRNVKRAEANRTFSIVEVWTLKERVAGKTVVRRTGVDRAEAEAWTLPIVSDGDYETALNYMAHALGLTRKSPMEVARLELRAFPNIDPNFVENNFRENGEYYARVAKKAKASTSGKHAGFTYRQAVWHMADAYHRMNAVPEAIRAIRRGSR